MIILINIIGILANLLSLTETIPQAISTWRYRHDEKALQAISVKGQVMTALRTSLWCLYGILTKDIYLPLATLVVLPIALTNIYLVKRNISLK